MKTDLVTSTVAAIIGIIVAYFLCNMILPPVADVSFKTLSSSTTYTLTDPDPEVFNYRAINPTVEVYVGQGAEYNQYGECIENIEYVEEEVIVEDETKPETDENENSNQDNENSQNNQDNQSNQNQENQPEVNGETQDGTSN